MRSAASSLSLSPSHLSLSLSQGKRIFRSGSNLIDWPRPEINQPKVFARIDSHIYVCIYRYVSVAKTKIFSQSLLEIPAGGQAERREVQDSLGH